jgi:hypothetical protein
VLHLVNRMRAKAHQPPLEFSLDPASIV